MLAVCGSAKTRCRRQWKDDSLEPAGAWNSDLLGSAVPDRKPEHFVFATERHGLDGEAAYLAGQAVPIRLTRPSRWEFRKTAWKAARKLAGAILKGDPDGQTTGLPDPRPGIPLPKVAKIVAWSPSTMVKMAARYGHFTTADLREAMETISTGSPVFSPVHTDKVGAKVQ
jgi:hypothetical protein